MFFMSMNSGYLSKELEEAAREGVEETSDTCANYQKIERDNSSL
jgi:hypothetical protein